MTEDQWKDIVDFVADAMLAHTRPFCTPLGTETEDLVRLVGSGTYMKREERRILLTCEHVARQQPIHHRFYGSNNIFKCSEEAWVMEKHPIDAALVPIETNVWESCQHQAVAVPYERFALTHLPSSAEELLFFRGYAGENAHYGFGVHETNASGYCSQEKKETGDQDIFELFWEPKHTQFTANTQTEARVAMKFDDPQGMSGSLVWNTRYLETINAGHEWTPANAAVTGLLRRWDDKTKTLLVWRVEHLRTWLEAKRA